MPGRHDTDLGPAADTRPLSPPVARGARETPYAAGGEFPRDAVTFAALQVVAGNRAVSRLLAKPAPNAVQRCGPTPCDCTPEERAEKETNQASAPVQRATSPDWAIRGKFPGAASVPNTIFFDMNETSPDATEQGKLAPLATPPTQALTLKGSTSEEGAAGLNASIASTRIAAVSSGLAAAGHTGARTPEPRPLAGAGNIDYRRARSVEVRPTGAVSPTPDCSAGPQPNDCGPAPSPFTTALARAHAMVASARAALAAPDAATTALLTQLFGGTAAAPTVSANLAAIDGQLTHMTPFGGTSGHRCVNTCDAACGAGATAYNDGDGPSALMTLCPIYLADPDLDSRASVLIHEGSHGTVGLTTDDQSYVWQRLITRLPPAMALNNADSYTGLVQLIVNPGSVTLGPSAPDTHAGGMSAAEQGQVDDAVAWLQQWIMGMQSEVSSLYGVIVESRTASPPSWSNTYYEETMTRIAPIFGLHAPPPVSGKTDQVAIAGISDRYDTLLGAVTNQLSLTKVGGAVTTWDAGPGTTVRFGTDFFASGQTARSRTELLLSAVIAADPNITAARRGQYRSALLSIVARGNIGTP